MCNCDSNSITPALDDGYITEKNELPVYSVHAGDTGTCWYECQIVVVDHTK